jgi:hypothetical protein
MRPPSDLTVEVYTSGTTRITDDLTRVTGLQFETMYPGGLYGAASFFVPRRIAQNWQAKGAQRVVFRRGQKIAYEGYLTNLQGVMSAGQQGVLLTAVGAWGALVETRRWRKRWADRRIGDDIWVYQEGAAGALKCNLDRLNRLQFSPLTELWNNGEYAAVKYTMPTGETAKRVTFGYAFENSDTTKPSVVFYETGGVFTDIPNAYDGDPSTNQSVTLLLGEYLYIGFHAEDTDRIKAGDTVLVRFNLTATVNTNAATMTAEYWDSANWVALPGYSDGTATGGKTLAQDGDMTFTRPGDWSAAVLNDANNTAKIWIRLTPSASLTAAQIAEIDFGETQSWSLICWNNTAASAEFTQSSVGTGTQDITFATPTQSLEFRMKAGKQQLASLGTVYGRVTSVVVYGETGSINLTEVVKDCGGASGSRLNGILSTSEALIGSNTFDLAAGGFVADDWGSTLPGIIQQAERFGDSAYNQWAVGVRASDLAPDGKPIMFAEAFPAMTDYDYLVSLAEADADFGLSLDYDDIWNWIAVRYTDEAGKEQFVTPDDDAALKDTASITAYGQRDYLLDASYTSLANAKNVARRFLASKKDPQYHMTRPLVVRDTIRTKAGGGRVPVALIRAGQRVRIADYLRDVNGAASTALTFLIARTSYQDSPPACTITAGVPDDLSVFIAQIR